MYGRSSFAGIFWKHDAFLESWLWATETLKTLQFNSTFLLMMIRTRSV